MSLLSDLIEQAASSPASAEQDGRKATARSLLELIAADRYLQGVDAAGANGSGWAGLRMARFLPPSATAESRRLLQNSFDRFGY